MASWAERVLTVASPPRVLHAKFAAYLGWSQPFIHELVTRLSERFPSAVITGRRENTDRFPIEDYLCVSRKWLVHPSSAWILATHLRERLAPDLIHAHFGWSGVRMLMLRHLLDIPLVTTFGGRDAGTDLRVEALRPLYRLLVEQSAHLICVSGPLRDALIEFGAPPERVSVVRRGTDTERFAFADRSDRGEGLRLLLVGRLVEKTGHLHALEALSRLRAQGVDASMRIVGKGPVRRALEERVAADRLGEVVKI